MTHFEGLRIVTAWYLTETVFQFPQHRFVEYDESDIWWLDKYGYGKWVTVPSKTAYHMGDTLIMHPDTWEALKKELELKKREREREYDFILNGDLFNWESSYTSKLISLSSW